MKHKPIIAILNNLVRLIMIASVILTFLYLKGCFQNKERLALLTELTSKQSNYRVPLHYPAVEDFMKKYYYSKKIPTDMQSVEIKGLVLKWLAIGNSPPMSGGVCIEFVGGKTSIAVCTLDELRLWAKDIPFYGWLGWWLLLTSTIGKLSIDLFSYFRDKKANFSTDE